MNLPAKYAVCSLLFWLTLLGHYSWNYHSLRPVVVVLALAIAAVAGVMAWSLEARRGMNMGWLPTIGLYFLCAVFVFVFVVVMLPVATQR
jgi:hypothetical protein